VTDRPTSPGLGRFDSWRQLLGKQVRVTLDRPDSGPAVIAEGLLLAFDDGGEARLRDEAGFVHYCWPMLDVQPLNSGEPKEADHG
jgi:hypothetical protein